MKQADVMFVISNKEEPQMMKCDDAALAALLNTCDDVGEQDTDVSEHVESCKHCQTRLSELAADAEQWDAVSQWLSPGEVTSEIYSESLDARERWKRPTAWSETMAKSLLSAASHPEMLGRIGRYDVERLIGSGGMGVVFKAYDTELNRPVAVKLLAPYLAGSGAARKRFAREARAAAAVVDDHVVPIHNVETESEHPFLVMKFIGGGSLQQRIDREGPLEVCEVLRIGMQTAKGLAAAHAQGLIHRDVKPSNILLDEGVDRALLTDFGLARASDDASLTRSGFHPGTPHYMSPEQVRGEAIDARSDLFGLGCVLYSLCTGHPPFRAETSYAVLRRIIDDTPRSIRETNPEVPEWLEQVVMKLLGKSAVDRFDSAAQVAELLEGCLAHVQKPTAIPLPVGVQALAAQTQLQGDEIPKPNRLKAIHQRMPAIAKYIAAAAGVFALFFAGILIVLELDKGTLTIESELDDVPIRIMQGEEVVKSLTVSKEGVTTRIGAGKYIVEIGQEFDKAVVKDGGVELSRGATAIVKVTQNIADTAETSPSKAEGATELEGIWHLESAIDSDGMPRKLELYDHWTFRGHRLLCEFATEGHWACDVEVDSIAKTIRYLKDGKELPSNADYVLDGDQLTIFDQPPHRKVFRRGRGLIPVAVKTQWTADSLVTITFSGTIDGASVTASGMGWRVDDAGHILLPSHVVPKSDDEAIKLRYASREHCSATRLKTLGHLTLLKSEQVVKGSAISLDSVTSLTSGDAVTAILNGTDNVPGSILKPRTTIAITELEGVKINPELRFQNIITTDFVADDTTLSGAPLLTKDGDVAGMLLRFGSAQLIAIPVAEIRESLMQLTTKDSALTVPPMEFDTLEDFLKPGRELFDKEMQQIDERLATVVDGSAEHSLLTTKKKQLQQQWDLSVAQVNGMAAAAKAGKPVQLAPIVIPNNSRPWQAPMPDPLLGHDEDIAKVLAGTWQVKRYVADGEDAPLGGATVTFSKNMMIMHFKLGDEEGDIQQVYRIGSDKIDIWHMDSGPDIRTALPYLGSYSLENDTLRICYHGRAMELETPQSRPPVQPGKGFIYLELLRDPIAEKVSVAKGKTDDRRTGQSYQISLLVLADDDLKPVAGATVDVTLIVDDNGVTGDGGYAPFKTNEEGIAFVDEVLWPGRYQINVRAPKDSRFRDTEFSKEGSILVVHEDGRYSPREFRLVVDKNKSPK